MARKPKVEDKFHCMTLLQWALVSLRDDLQVSLKELAESLNVNYNNIVGWVSLRTFPGDVDEWYSFVEQFPDLGKYGSYSVLKSDYKEYLGNPNWPTKGLQAYAKACGYTYYKNKGQFEASFTVPEKNKVEKRFNKFKEFCEIVEQSSPQGKTLIKMLLDKIGEIPSTYDVDAKCIFDKEEYEATVKELQRKDDILINARSEIAEASFLVRKLRMEYEKILSGESTPRSKREEELKNWEETKTRLNWKG